MKKTGEWKNLAWSDPSSLFFARRKSSSFSRGAEGKTENLFWHRCWNFKFFPPFWHLAGIWTVLTRSNLAEDLAKRVGSLRSWTHLAISKAGRCNVARKRNGLANMWEGQDSIGAFKVARSIFPRSHCEYSFHPSSQLTRLLYVRARFGKNDSFILNSTPGQIGERKRG